uniref:Uncharacterized protein n=1 Tax=Oryza glaberrima TaxID=4538 RepID=I1PK44_ORYGL
MTIVEVEEVGLVIDVISVGAKAKEQHNAAAILFYLSSNNSDASWRRSRRWSSSSGTAHTHGQKNAMVILYGLLQSAANLSTAIAAGAVLALMTLLSNDRDDLAQDSIVLLARKAWQTSGAVAVLSQSGLAEALAASSSYPSANVIEQHDMAVHKKHH